MKRIKASFEDIVSNDISYFNFGRCKYHGIYGDYYIVDKALTPEQVKALEQFKNVVFGGVVNRYAPELRYNTIILLDRVIKEGEK